MKITIISILSSILLISCNQSENKENRIRIADYTDSKEEINIDTGMVRFNNNTKEMQTHSLDSGSKLVFVYKRCGVAMMNESDWEAKYTETLIFQIDSSVNKFNYCDNKLKSIDCKYYWICLTEKVKKEIINIKKGCIKGSIMNDSILVNIDVNSEFGFGGFMEKGNSRTIKYKFAIQ